jgi:hypothetical protein
MFIQNERIQAFLDITSKLPPELMIAVRQANDVTFGRITLDQASLLRRPKEESESGEDEKQGQ